MLQYYHFLFNKYIKKSVLNVERFKGEDYKNDKSRFIDNQEHRLI